MFGIRAIVNRFSFIPSINRSLSTSNNLFHDKKDHRKKWVTPDAWETLKSGKDAIPWLSSLPQRRNKDEWSREEACFGMYDYLPILGNDVTINNKMLCRGPGYVRAHNANELRRLIKKRRQLGYQMHIEDLNTINKRISYLMTRENRKKLKTHG